MSGGDELAHQVKHASSQQTEAYRPGVYGHVASYDSNGHRVKLVIPSMGDGDGNYVLTGWMPLGTIAAGNGWGVQIAPMGGASLQNPTAGEKCQIAILERNYGVTIGATMCFDQVYAPPFTAMKPGEVALKAAAGGFVYLDDAGQVELNSAALIQLVAPRTATSGNLAAGTGCSGSFTTPTGQTVTVQDGIITNIF
jgi:hypothetical protein